ncbi:MAG: hypothetical protein ABWZ56_07265 [Flavobacterium sp.]
MIAYLCILPKNTGFIKPVLFSSVHIGKLYSNVEATATPILDTLFDSHFLYYSLKYFVIPFLLWIIFSLLILLIINRYYFEKSIIPKKEAEIKINNFLTEIIFSNHNLTHIKEKINLFKYEVPFKNKWCRDLILTKIITIKQNINGVNPTHILLIYKFFGFQDYSQKLIRNRRWHNKALGIYHYQMLDYKIKKGHIKTHINDKNKFLKSNALIALISLSDEKLDFLNNYQEKISKADELKILDIIYQRKSSLPKNINEWFNNKNSSIVILAIKLMIQYRETLNISQIKFLLSSNDPLVRKETLLAIRELVIIDSNALLIPHYSRETNKRNKISLLKTWSVIGNHKTKDFVSNILSEEKDLEIKFEMINCINKLDNTYFKNYTTDNTPENEVIHRILLHVNDPNLI